MSHICIAFSGIDHIDAEEVRTRKITVKNARGYADRSVSELVIALTLELYRNIRKASSVITGRESYNFPLGEELSGKIVAIFGKGNIGRAAGQLFSAFGCEVLYYTRGVEEKSLLEAANIVSLHLPLTKETFGFFDRIRLGYMRSDAILINTARALLVEQEALIEVLQKKKIAGAAFDVFEQEPPLREDHPLLRLPNFFGTPHIGYRTLQAGIRKADLTLQNLESSVKEFFSLSKNCN